MTRSSGRLCVAIFFAHVTALVADIGKNTYAASDPVRAVAWLQRFLPVRQEDWRDCVNDTYCPCGELGRVYGDVEGTHLVNPWPTGEGVDRRHGFSIHTVNSRMRSGHATLATVEEAFTRKFAAAVTTGVYDAFMDFNTGFWTQTLDPYIEAFDAAGVAYFVLSWTGPEETTTADGGGSAYWSVIVQVGGAPSVLIELMSEHSSALQGRRAAGWLPPRPPAARASLPRYVFEIGGAPSTAFPALAREPFPAPARPFLFPAKVGRAAADLAAARSFYVDALRGMVSTRVERKSPRSAQHA